MRVVLVEFGKRHDKRTNVLYCRRNCYEEVTRKLLPWNLAFSQLLRALVLYVHGEFGDPPSEKLVALATSLEQSENTHMHPHRSTISENLVKICSVTPAMNNSTLQGIFFK